MKLYYLHEWVNVEYMRICILTLVRNILQNCVHDLHATICTKIELVLTAWTNYIKFCVLRCGMVFHIRSPALAVGGVGLLAQSPSLFTKKNVLKLLSPSLVCVVSRSHWRADAVFITSWTKISAHPAVYKAPNLSY